MTCRSGVVSVAIVVSTARTTASVLTPEPNTLRARTGWSGRVLYAPLVGPGVVVRGVHDVWGVCRWICVPTAVDNGVRCAHRLPIVLVPCVCG